MAPSNGTTSTAPCNGILVPRPMRKSGSSPSPPTGSKNPYSYRYLGKNRSIHHNLSDLGETSSSSSSSSLKGPLKIWKKNLCFHNGFERFVWMVSPAASIPASIRPSKEVGLSPPPVSGFRDESRCFAHSQRWLFSEGPGGMRFPTIQPDGFTCFLVLRNVCWDLSQTFLTAKVKNWKTSHQKGFATWVYPKKKVCWVYHKSKQKNDTEHQPAQQVAWVVWSFRLRKRFDLLTFTNVEKT